MSTGGRLAGWLFAGPALLVIALFFALPVLAALALSVTDFDIYALADLKNMDPAQLEAASRAMKQGIGSGMGGMPGMGKGMGLPSGLSGMFKKK